MTRTIRIGNSDVTLSLVPGDQERSDVLPEDVATCGTCGRSWDDEQSTGWTPTPGGRCPFEYDHTPTGHGLPGADRRQPDERGQGRLGYTAQGVS